MFTEVVLSYLKPAHTTTLVNKGASHTTGYYQDYRSRGSDAAPLSSVNNSMLITLASRVRVVYRCSATALQDTSLIGYHERTDVMTDFVS